MRETRSSHRGAISVIYGAVIQRTVDRPDEYAPGYHLALDTETGGYVAVGRLRVSSLLDRSHLAVHNFGKCG